MLDEKYQTFKEHFKNYTDNYVLIGGTAATILADDAFVAFRSTKDFDMVVIMETLDEEFTNHFWNFIKDSGYSDIGESDGEHNFYRFQKPTSADAPSMIELFSKRPIDYLIDDSLRTTPIHISESVTSLSALVLDSGYYDLLAEGKIVINGFSVLSTKYLVVFKAKAWLDLSDRRDRGEAVDSRNIKKHINDIFRLHEILEDSESIILPTDVTEDMSEFINRLASSGLNPTALPGVDSSLNDITSTYKSILNAQ